MKKTAAKKKATTRKPAKKTPVRKKSAVNRTTKVAQVVKRSGRGSKPGERRGGRRKGTPNKVSGSVKEAVLETFMQLGGVTHMAEWAGKNPGDFYRILARLLPREVTGEGGAPIPVATTNLDFSDLSAEEAARAYQAFIDAVN